MSHRLAAACAALLLTSAAAPALAADAPAAWDGLVKVDSKKLDAVYLAPGADFRPYTKVILDPTEVAFQKNYKRDMNRDTMDPSNRITSRPRRSLIGRWSPISTMTVRLGYTARTMPSSIRTFGRGWQIGPTS